MLYQRLQRKRILRLVVFTAAVALLCVLAQLSLSQGSLAAGAVLFEASAPQPETLCTLPASPSQALPSPQDFLRDRLGLFERRVTSRYITCYGKFHIFCPCSVYVRTL